MEIDRWSLFDGVALKPGDRITFAGMYTYVPNPDRRWWQIWRPRYVPTDQLQEFTVVDRA